LEVPCKVPVVATEIVVGFRKKAAGAGCYFLQELNKKKLQNKLNSKKYFIITINKLQ
jgi:hypothetical protein